jgi:hypothetical protein
VPGDAVAADHDQLRAALVHERQRRAERLARLRHGLGGAQAAPDVLARERVQREQVGLVAGGLAAAAHGDVALEDLHHQPAFVQQRAGGERPLERERPEVALPELFPADLERGQLAGAEEKHDDLSVGHRRR